MSNTSPRISYIYDRYSKASQSRPAVIEMRITYEKRQKYISTGISVYPHQWRRGLVVNCPEAMVLNSQLDKMLMDVRQVIFDMSKEGSIDIFSIPRRLAMRDIKTDFMEFCRQRATVRKYGRTADSQKRYDRFMRLFTRWGRIKEFSDITDRNIILFDRHLKKRGLMNYSKWNNYHRFLNSFILDAINEGLLRRNPYKWVNIVKDKASRGLGKCLTPDEFRRLRTAHMPTQSLERVRDLFVFQTYTCLSYSDLRDFDPALIADIKDTKVYISKRHKTHSQFTIPLLSPSLLILEKYCYRLPVISNVKYNQYLKVVAQAAGIDKPITTHWARHTGATLLLNEGVDMRIVSRICGHSSTKITEQVYARLLDETVVKAVDSVRDNI